MVAARHGLRAGRQSSGCRATAERRRPRPGRAAGASDPETAFRRRRRPSMSNSPGETPTGGESPGKFSIDVVMELMVAFQSDFDDSILDGHFRRNGRRRLLAFLEERAIAAIALCFAQHFLQSLHNE